MESIIHEIVRADEQARDSLAEHNRKKENVVSEVLSRKNDIEEKFKKVAENELEEFKQSLDKELKQQELKLELQFENFKNLLEKQFHNNEEEWIASIYERCIR